MSAAEPIIPVAGRTCGDCAMCCKIPEIPVLDKPYNTWCSHCSTRTSCDIHASRPQMCRDYHCHFMLSDLPEEWRPSKSRILLSFTPGKMVVAVDPARPDAWRKEPYFSNITHWSSQVDVHVLIGPKTYVVFPDHVDDVGEITADHQIMTLEESTPQGRTRRAVRSHKSEVPEGMHVGVPFQLPKN